MAGVSPLVLQMAGVPLTTLCHQSNVGCVLQAAMQMLPAVRKFGHGRITSHMTKHVPLLKQSSSAVVCKTDFFGGARLALHILAHHEPESIKTVHFFVSPQSSS